MNLDKFEEAYIRSNAQMAFTLAEALVSVNEEGEEDNERARHFPPGSTYRRALRQAHALRKRGNVRGANRTLDTAVVKTDYRAKRRRERVTQRGS